MCFCTHKSMPFSLILTLEYNIPLPNQSGQSSGQINKKGWKLNSLIVCQTVSLLTCITIHVSKDCDCEKNQLFLLQWENFNILSIIISCFLSIDINTDMNRLISIYSCLFHSFHIYQSVHIYLLIPRIRWPQNKCLIYYL